MMNRVLLFALATVAAHAQTTATTTAQINTTPKPVSGEINYDENMLVLLENCGPIWGRFALRKETQQLECIYLAFKDIYFIYFVIFAAFGIIFRVLSQCSCYNNSPPPPANNNMYTHTITEYFLGFSCCECLGAKKWSYWFLELMAFGVSSFFAFLSPEMIFIFRIYASTGMMNTEAPRDANRQAATDERAPLVPPDTQPKSSRFNDPIRPRIQFPSLKRQMNVAEP